MKDAKAASYAVPGKQRCGEQASVCSLVVCPVLEEPAEARLIICSVDIWLFLKCAVLDSAVFEPSS